MTTRWIQRAFAVLLVALAGISSLSPALAGGELIKSGYLGYPTLNSTPSVYWLDDTRVLFIGGERGEFEQLPDGRHPYRRWLMEWNTVTRRVQKLAPMGEVSRLCYDRGYVRYWHVAAGKQIVRSGPLGSEVVREYQVGGDEQRRNVEINWFSCKEYDRKALIEEFGENLWPLREEHGYWKGRREAGSQTVMIYVSLLGGGRREIVTPISGSFQVHWSEYAQSYVFLQRRTSYSQSEPRPGRMWLMKLTGETSAIEIPFGNWLRGSHGVQVVRPGLFVWSHNVLDRAAGGYLITDGRVSRLVDGYIHNLAVAPNGCDVAMNIESHSPLGRGDTEIAAINVCDNRGGKWR